MYEVKESCPVHIINLISCLYYPFPWSQTSHNSSSFFLRIAFQFFAWSMSLMMRGRNRGDVGAHTATCSTARSPGYHCSIRRCSCSSKICIFLILTGNKFHAPKHGMGWMLLPSPFSCFRLRRGFAEASNLGGAAVFGPIQSALRNFCPSSPKHFTPFFIIASPTSCL